MLRNCDYELAGTVLMQQYYDNSKNTELNRLLDAYMDDPCFDNAVKLIKYNDMFVFYFTESCKGGLYVRKSGKKDEFAEQSKHAEPIDETDKPSADLSPTQAADTTESAFEPSSKSQKLHDLFDDLEQSILAERSSRRIREAEPIIEPIVETRANPSIKAGSMSEQLRVTYDTNDAHPDTDVHPTFEQTDRLSDTKEAGMLHDASSVSVETNSMEAVQETEREEIDVRAQVTDEIAYDEVAATANLDKPSRSEAATVANMDNEVLPKEVTASDLDNWWKQGKLDKLEADSSTNDPAIENAAASRLQQKVTADHTYFDVNDVDPQSTRFPNVVSTLVIDIKDMKSQMEEYKAQMFENPREAVKLKKWVNTLEEAVDEFTEALRVLSNAKK